jgi:2-polyprenyl-3-methyl-5-hydroxy-6-metoxy-1,4-benzoquinol methylase
MSLIHERVLLGLKKIPGVQMGWNFLHSWRISPPPSYAPVRLNWEKEHSDEDRRKHIWGLAELPRYSILCGYIKVFTPPDGIIIDVGCGEGMLHHKLSNYPYGRYIGIDISETAIKKASLRESADTRSVFIQADATQYESPECDVNVAVLNEILYYCDDPRGVVDRYAKLLKPNGVILISVYQNWLTRAMAIEKLLANDYEMMEMITTTSASKGLTWKIYVYRPLSVYQTF